MIQLDFLNEQEIMDLVRGMKEEKAVGLLRDMVKCFKEVKGVKQTAENVRKSLYARNNELERRVMELEDKVKAQ
jgi:hypothetical protein